MTCWRLHGWYMQSENEHVFLLNYSPTPDHQRFSFQIIKIKIFWACPFLDIVFTDSKISVFLIRGLMPSNSRTPLFQISDATQMCCWSPARYIWARICKELLPRRIMDLALSSKLVVGISFLFPLTPTDMPMEQRLKYDDSNYQYTRRKHRKQIYHFRVTKVLLSMTKSWSCKRKSH